MHPLNQIMRNNEALSQKDDLMLGSRHQEVVSTISVVGFLFSTVVMFVVLSI